MNIVPKLLVLILALSSCFVDREPEDDKSADFSHDVTSKQKPWNSISFEETEKDFTFGIISDLTGGERPGIFSVAVEQINRLDPTFVVSVGDLIEGGTVELDQLEREWDSFESRADKLAMPFFYLGGNHDLSNPVMQQFWKDRFGVLYYHFVYENVLFLMLDSEDFEGDYDTTRYFHMPEWRTGAISQAQLDYFTKVLTENPEVRWTFVLMHKPLWTREDDKGLGKLEELLQDRAYTVINGHEHSFSHQIRNERDYIMLGTTGGFQSEEDEAAFDHFTLVRMADDKPIITHLRMDGVLDERGHIPNGGDSLSFQASRKK